MNYKDFNFDIIDLDKTDTIPSKKINDSITEMQPEINDESNVEFQGEITYTEPEIQVIQPQSEITMDSSDTINDYETVVFQKEEVDALAQETIVMPQQEIANMTMLYGDAEGNESNSLNRDTRKFYEASNTRDRYTSEDAQALYQSEDMEESQEFYEEEDAEDAQKLYKVEGAEYIQADYETEDLQIGQEEEDELESLGDLDYHDEDVFLPRAKKKVSKEKQAKHPIKGSSHNSQHKKSQHRRPELSKSKGDHIERDRNTRNRAKTQNGAMRRPNTAASSRQTERKEKRSFLSNLSWMDAVIGITAVALVGIVIFIGSLWIGNNRTATEVGEFVSIGSELSNLGTVGLEGINKIAEASTSEVVTEVVDEQGESISLAVNFTSVSRDLKIKFSDKSTDQLISGVGFTVQAVTPSNKTVTWVDEDKDGVIYQDELKPGEYAVTIQSIDGFTFPTEATMVTVKDKISYQAINVVNEVKKESEINVAKEDTENKAEIDTGTILTDTVGWVASTKTIMEGADGYAKIDRSTIKDPATLVAGIPAFYWRANQINEAAITMNVNQKATASCTITEDPAYNYAYVWSVDSSGASIATVTASSTASTTVLGIGVGTTNIFCNVTITPKTTTPTSEEPSTSTESSSPSTQTPSASTEVPSASGTPSSTETSSQVATLRSNTVPLRTSPTSTTETHVFPVTVIANAYVSGVTLDKTSAIVKLGTTGKLTATVTGDANCNKGVTWASSDNTVATVDANGTITPIKIGKVTITATTVGTNSTNQKFEASCVVDIKPAADLAVTLDKTTDTLPVGEAHTLVATVAGYVSKQTVTWKSSDTKIATVSNTGVVTGIAVGTATITVTTDESGADGKPKTATCTVTVKANPKMDKVTLLKDSSGNQVYIKGTDGKYIEAKWADYYTATEFYILSSVKYKYTGWQTIDGKTYYYDANGKVVTGEQVISGMKYNFANDGSLSMNGGTLGIDVSKWNGTIDWNAVKNSGISFVIIRCGYRGSETGVLVEDPKFRSYASGANAAGLKVGLYFFTQAVNEVEAVQEASLAVSLAGKYSISYPIFIDTEYTSGGRANGLSTEARTAVCRAFCETVKSAGYTPGIYASKTWFTSNLNTGELNSYKIWLAQYASTPTYNGRYDMWQYSSKGNVSGIKGNVDMNISYLGY